MKRIGVLGENENDVASIVALLRGKFVSGFEFFSLLLDVNGDSLPMKSIKRGSEKNSSGKEMWKEASIL